MNEINTRNIGTVETVSVSRLCKKSFKIKYYQRGYRWKKVQVRQLLDDIHSFTPTHTASFYFLQALAVSEIEDDALSVVDGQQRLTTIALMQELLSSFGDSAIKITYERNQTGMIDEHYRREAKETIQEWIEGHSSNEKKTLLNRLNEACFLLYKVSPDEELDVFDRLNSGKISAKDSELVKCVMLTPLLDEPSFVTQARANEWDEIERALADDYFFAFFVKRNSWKENDRMAMLLRMAGFCKGVNCEARKSEVFPFLKWVMDGIRESSRGEVWKKIYLTYYQLSAWYNDSVMYHAVGWYVHSHNSEVNEVSLKVIQNAFNKVQTQVKNNSKDNEQKIDWFNDNKDCAISNLFLFNVAYCWRRWPMRYDFLRHRQISVWTLEHIGARNERKLTKEEFVEFSPLELKEEDWKDYVAACNSEMAYTWLAGKVKGYSSEDDHDIGNLALLGRDENASLNNGIFKDKRLKVQEWASSKEYWVPPATQAVFLKMISGTDSRTPFWSQKDKKMYVESMQNEVHSFIHEF